MTVTDTPIPAPWITPGRYPMREHAAADLRDLLGPNGLAAIEEEAGVLTANSVGPDLGDIAALAIGRLDMWLAEGDEAEIAIAQQLLSERPGDTDLTAARATVREVLDALRVVLSDEIGPMGDCN